MKIGGILKFSLIDYPGKMAAVVFTQGCNFRCPYCHNPELVLPQQFKTPLSEGEVLTFLEKRRGQLEGVVVSGGEPTVQKDLLDFLQKVKRMEYGVKLDTNGSHPKVLQEAIDQQLIDYVAMDIKAPLKKYCFFTQGRNYTENIRQSITVIIDSGLPHEFRTTYVEQLISSEDISDMSALVKNDQSYRTQPFILRKMLVNSGFFKSFPHR